MSNVIISLREQLSWNRCRRQPEIMLEIRKNAGLYEAYTLTLEEAQRLSRLLAIYTKLGKS